MSVSPSVRRYDGSVHDNNNHNVTQQLESDCIDCSTNALQNQMAGHHVLWSARNIDVHYAICDALQEPLPWSTEHCVALTRVLEMCSQVCAAHDATMRTATLVSAQVTCTKLCCITALFVIMPYQSKPSNNMSLAMGSILHVRPAPLCAPRY